MPADHVDRADEAVDDEDAVVLAVVDEVQFPGVRNCSSCNFAVFTITVTAAPASTSSSSSSSSSAISDAPSSSDTNSIVDSQSQKEDDGCRPPPVAQPLPPPAGPANVSMPPGTAGPRKTPGAAPDPPSALAVDPRTPKRPSVARSAAQRIASWSPASLSGVSNSDNNKSNNNISTPNKHSTNNKNSSGRQSIFRRLSPSLAARVKLLDGASGRSDASSVRSQSKSPVGKIPVSQLQELERQDREVGVVTVQRRGRAWSGALLAPQGDEEQDSGGVFQEAVDEQQQQHQQNISDTDISTAPPATQSPQDMAATAGMTSHGAAIEDYTGHNHGSYTTDVDDLPPPPPPPKDTPPLHQYHHQLQQHHQQHSSSGSNASDSYFNPLGLSRTDSIYSFSRASFSSQLQQLTSISLPQPSTLEESIASISTAPAAVRALSGAAEQIQKWTNKASDVLGGLEAEDDVEWAAAGGREGLDDVDKAVTKFESLVNVYVKAIEEVQVRDDIADVGPESLNNVVTQMERTIRNWGKVGALLRGVKEQVELAMEWEELWNAVLGDVGLEIDNLSRMIFEMEEKRHKAVMVSDAESEQTTGLDINELETIVEETPSNIPSNPRLNLGAILPSGSQTPSPEHQQNESSLLALFARMQPLRASLDFLPMRLSMFQSRAKGIFPSACEELEDRRLRLEQGYKKLETDAEALRRELGEDRWVIVFRNAGKQAHKMCESVERSVQKLQEAVDGGIQHNNPAALAKRAENFEAKKIHYGSAIERVLSIIQKGVNDRLTVNGEIIRLLADLTTRFESLQSSIRSMDSLLDELNSRQLRDSVSSILTLDSPAGRSIGTPGSSPASSVVLTNGNTMTMDNSGRRSSVPGISNSSNSINGTSTASRNMALKLKRHSALPQPSSSGIGHTPRKPSIPRAVTTSRITTTSTTARPPSRTGIVDPLTALTYNHYVPDGRPRWNVSYNTKDLAVGHIHRAPNTPSPSSGRNLPVPISRSPRSSQQYSSSFSLGLRSPLSRESSASPAPGRPSSRLHRGVTDRGMLDPGVSNCLSPSPSPSPKPSSMFDPPPYSKRRKPVNPTAAAAPVPTSTTSRATVSKLMPPTPLRMGSRTPVPTTPTPKTTLAPTTPRPSLATAPRSRQSYAGFPSPRSPSISISNDGGASAAAIAAVKKTALPHVAAAAAAAATARPGTSLGHSSRRSSMLPIPRTGAGARSGRDSVSGTRKDDRPPWR